MSRDTAPAARDLREPVELEIRRALPDGAVPLVAVRDPVRSDTVIARGHRQRRVLRLPAGENFELLKRPGDPVKRGETVAVAEELFGLGLREYVSPCDGVVESVNTRKTALVLAAPDSEIRALLPGVVSSVSPEEVRLRVTARRIEGRFGFGEAVAGRLWNAGELITEAEVRRKLGPHVQGRVVAAESLVLPSVLPALAAYGAAALVCGAIDLAPLWDLVSPDGPHPAGRGLPTLVVTGGFGLHRMDEAAREALADAEGRTVYAAGPQTGRLTFAGPPYAEVVIPAGI